MSEAAYRAVVTNDLLRRIVADLALGDRRDLADYRALWPDRSGLLEQLWKEIFAGASPHATPPGPPQLGPFRLEGELGRGGQGIVHRAVDTRLQRTVALKVLRHSGRSTADLLRFRREARAAAGLRHAALCTVYETGEVDGRLYVAMELLPGPTLQQCIDRHRADPDAAPGPVALPNATDATVPARLRAVLEVLEGTAIGLQHAHDRGLVHRDVKPSNITFSATLQPVVLDFGLARDIDGNDDVTRRGIVLGTPGYVAPEAFVAESADVVCSPRLDVWSLGVVLYTLASGGRPPFRSDSPTAWLDAVRGRRRPRLRGLPRTVRPALERLLRDALAHRPERRLGSCAEFARRLRAIASRSGDRRRRTAVGWIAVACTTALSMPLAWLGHRLASAGRPDSPASSIEPADASRSALENSTTFRRDGEFESIELGWTNGPLGPSRRRPSYSLTAAHGGSFVGLRDGDIVLHRFGGELRRFHSAQGALDSPVITASGSIVAACQGPDRVVWFDVATGVEGSLVASDGGEFSGLCAHGEALVALAGSELVLVDPLASTAPEYVRPHGDGLPGPLVEAVLLGPTRALLRGGTTRRGRAVAGTSDDARLALVALDDGKVLGWWSEPDQRVRLLDLVDAAGRFARLDQDAGRLEVRDAEGRLRFDFAPAPGDAVLSFSLTRDGRLAVLTRTAPDTDATLHVVDCTSGARHDVPIRLAGEQAWPFALADPSCMLLAQGGLGFDLIDLRSGGIVGTFRSADRWQGRHWVGPLGRTFYTCCPRRGAVRAVPLGRSPDAVPPPPDAEPAAVRGAPR
ncbi:MAG: protein kinase [Planctomycetes bacterium]|nr:protein kinase [Planctomycetota bacterium]